MGNGRKRIEIKKIEKESSRMVTFSKRRRGLFKKAQELQAKTGANVAILVFSPAGRPFTFGDVDSISAALNTSTADQGTSTSAACPSNRNDHNGLRLWLDSMNVEGCDQLDELLRLKQELQETKERIESTCCVPSCTKDLFVC